MNSSLGDKHEIQSESMDNTLQGFSLVSFVDNLDSEERCVVLKQCLQHVTIKDLLLSKLFFLVRPHEVLTKMKGIVNELWKEIESAGTKKPDIGSVCCEFNNEYFLFSYYDPATIRFHNISLVFSPEEGEEKFHYNGPADNPTVVFFKEHHETVLSKLLNIKITSFL
jgi:hypothetical protein